MAKYDEMDRLIVKAIKARNNPRYDAGCYAESKRLAAATGRDDFRVIDGRLQALRKAGKIRHLTKAESNGKGGWHVV